MSTNENTANTRSKGRYALLSIESDAKTIKGTEYGYLTGILYLAPASEADPTRNLCPKASAECRQACLYGAGMAGVFPSIKRARIAKTLLFLNNQAAFVETLASDIGKLILEAKSRGLKPAVRINGTSDLPKLAHALAVRFPDVQFYDYTKLPWPWKRTLPNYHLTFSHSGENMADCVAALVYGINVAVVFAGSLPETWNGYRVVNGDLSDLRFLDPKGVIVGLKAKGTARSIEAGGFVQIGKVA
jgi:hypothetical protein